MNTTSFREATLDELLNVDNGGITTKVAVLPPVNESPTPNPNNPVDDKDPVMHLPDTNEDSDDEVPDGEAPVEEVPSGNDEVGTDDPDTNDEVNSDDEVGTDGPGTNDEVNTDNEVGTDDPGTNDGVNTDDEVGTDDPDTNDGVNPDDGAGTDGPGTNDGVNPDNEVGTDDPDTNDEVNSDDEVGTDGPGTNDEVNPHDGAGTDAPGTNDGVNPDDEVDSDDHNTNDEVNTNDGTDSGEAPESDVDTTGNTDVATAGENLNPDAQADELSVQEKARDLLISNRTINDDFVIDNTKNDIEYRRKMASSNSCSIIVGKDINGRNVTLDDYKLKKMDITIKRKHDSYGNEFDSTRTLESVTLENGQKINIKVTDKVGANAKDAAWAAEHKGRTLPDGKYYLSAKNLTKNSKETYDSVKFRNVLKLKTDDKNIAPEIRNEVNNGAYLFHATCYSDDYILQKGEHRSWKSPYSAGCVSSQAGGQDVHDEFMNMLHAIPNYNNISVEMFSETNL